MTWSPVRFFYQHSLHDLLASSQASGYGVENLLNSFESDLWKATSINTQTIRFDAGSGYHIGGDYFAMAEHNLRTAGGFIELQRINYYYWTQVQCGATPRAQHTSQVLSGEMFVFGGLSDTSSSLNDLWKFNPSSPTPWTQVTCGATPRRQHAAAVMSGELFIFGGWSYQGSRLNDLWKYNPTSPTPWTQVQCGATRRFGHSAVVMSNELYVFGGSDVSASLKDLWKFNPTSPTPWTQVTCGATERYGHTAVVISGSMFIFGGFSDAGSYLNDLWKYSPTSPTPWLQLTAGATRRYGHTAVVMSGEMYIYGGYGVSGYLNDLWKYNPTSPGVWTQLVAAPTTRWSAASFVLSGELYVHGGNNDGTVRNDQWKYIPLGVFSADNIFGPTGLDGDDLYLRTFSAISSMRAFQLVVSSCTQVPHIAIAQLGYLTDLGYLDVKTDPHAQERKANINISKTGYLQGIHTYYTERRLDLAFSSITDSLYSEIDAWWNANGLRNFFVQWESSQHSGEIWLLHPDTKYEAPMKVGGFYRDFKITLRGRKTR